MSRRSYLAASLAALMLLSALACGSGATVTRTVATPTSESAPIPVPAATSLPDSLETVESTPTPRPPPVETATALPEPTPTPTPEATPMPTPTPSIDLDVNGAGEPSGPADGKLSTVEISETLTPSIVQITTEVLTPGLLNEPIPRQGVGTGVVLDHHGYILTNNHVIEGAQSITVITDSDESLSAELVGGDFNTDLAVIRVEARDLTPAVLGNSSELRVGEDVIAIGHALGLPGGPTVSKGVVSALDRSINIDAQTTIVDLIQTDASINPGNSGGALVNTQAQVIGINTAIIPGSQGIGFAISIDDAKIVVAQLIAEGTVNRGFLGITPVNVSPALASQMELPVMRGILVARVIDGTAAAAVDLQRGDVIVVLNDQVIANTGELSKFLIAHPPGETISMVYYRGAEELRAEVTLGERPQP